MSRAKGAGKAALLLGLVVLAAWPRVAGAGWLPDEVAGGAGWAVLIRSDADKGGVAVSGAALWDLQTALASRFGVAAYATDQGSVTGPVFDRNDPTVNLGTGELFHRAIYGVAWRGDVYPWGARGLRPLLSGSWGYYRLSGDRLGHQFSAESATGASLGLGLKVPLPAARHAAVIAVTYHRVVSDVTSRYVTIQVSDLIRRGPMD
jgi:hypothetical protein